MKTLLRLVLVLLLSIAAFGQLPNRIPLGHIYLGYANPVSGITEIDLALNDPGLIAADLNDIVVNVNGRKIHTGPIHLPVFLHFDCHTGEGSPCPPPPYDFLSLQFRFYPLPSTEFGEVVITDNSVLVAYGIQTTTMGPRPGERYLHLQTIDPNTPGQSIPVALWGCPHQQADTVKGCSEFNN